MTQIIGWPGGDPILSNVLVYRQIAIDALRRSQEWNAKHIRGNVKSLDLNQTSFKDSLIAIVFGGMVIEASLWVVGCDRLGEPTGCGSHPEQLAEFAPSRGVHLGVTAQHVVKM